MTLSTFCYILAIAEWLIGIPMLVFPEKTAQWFIQFKKDDSLLRVVGAMFLMISVLVLLEDPTPGADIAGLMRLVAWLTAVKSLAFCWCPKWHSRLSERFLSTSGRRYVMGSVAVVWGVLFFLAGTALR